MYMAELDKRFRTVNGFCFHVVSHSWLQEFMNGIVPCHISTKLYEKYKGPVSDFKFNWNPLCFRSNSVKNCYHY